MKAVDTIDSTHFAHALLYRLPSDALPAAPPTLMPDEKANMTMEHEKRSEME